MLIALNATAQQGSYNISKQPLEALISWWNW